jgi:hypothetical protein
MESGRKGGMEAEQTSHQPNTSSREKEHTRLKKRISSPKKGHQKR